MQTRTFQISALALVLFAVVCTRIPLVNYLGFEFSAFTVLLAGYLSGILTLALWKQTNPGCKSDVWRLIGRSAAVSFILLAIPFILSLANALFVKNCSLGDGAALYALTVIPGTAFLISLALFVGVVFGTWRKTIFTGLYVLILFHIPCVTLIRPQLFAFNPIIGFFPGFTYDETLQVVQRLLTYRMATLAGAGCIAAGSVWLWQIRLNKKETVHASRSALPIIELVVIALLAPVVVIVFTLSDRLGLSSSEEYIRQKLAGHYTTTHFEIIYSAGSIKRARIEQIGSLHEYYFEKLSHELNIHSQERIISFLYASPEQKGRLLGAVNTDFAKPWLRQIHLNIADVESALNHEMVHVLAGEFGWSPFKVSPNIGLVEGIAVAVSGRTSMRKEANDRSTALVFASGIRPNLESLFKMTNFVQTNPSVTYTLAGSFCGFLIDSFGVDQFKRLYASGDFKKTYKKNLPLLLAEWQSSIERIPLDGPDSMKARYFFRRPSIFGKECARVIANINAETREYLIRHEFDKAFVSAEQSLRLSKTPEAVSQKAAALSELRRFKECVEFINIQIRDTSIGYTLLPLHLRLGDAYWALDSIDRAKQEFETMARIHLNAWYEELCALRLEALKFPQDRSELQIYFTYSMEDTTRMARLERLTSPVARYLLAREYAAKERFNESARIFESIGPMQSETIEFFRLRRLGRDWLEQQEFEKAQAALTQSLPRAPNTVLRSETLEWIEQCEWMRK
jgi:hypothetical protein